MLRQTFLTLSNSHELQDIALHNSLARKVALRFVAGETLPQAIRAVTGLNSKGITATLDHLGEHVDHGGAAKAAADSYMQALERIKGHRVNRTFL